MSAKATQNGRADENRDAKDDCLYMVLYGLVGNAATFVGMAALGLSGIAGVLLPVIALLISVPALFASIRIGLGEPWMEVLYGEDWEDKV